MAETSCAKRTYRPNGQRRFGNNDFIDEAVKKGSGKRLIINILQFTLSIQATLSMLYKPGKRYEAQIKYICDCTEDSPNKAIAQLGKLMKLKDLSEYGIDKLPDFEPIDFSCRIPEVIKDFAELFGLTIEFQYVDCDGNWMADYKKCDVRESPGTATGVYGRGAAPQQAIDDFLREIKGQEIWLPKKPEHEYRKYAQFTGVDKCD